MLKGQKKGQPAGKMLHCKCGVEFYATPAQVSSGRKKYCSSECKYKFRVRPKGLTYKIVAVNKAWIKPGQRFSPETSFQKGQPASGRPFRKGHVPANFRGSEVRYGGLHSWVRRNKGKPSKCDFCGASSKLHWANRSWEYKREIDDWLPLCAKCHQRYDRAGAWGAASDKFPEIRK